MNALLSSFLLVFISEMGDKTQLLALLLALRFRRPAVILAGITVATVANHALAAWLGSALAAWADPTALKWGLALSFFGFAAWILVPDKEQGLDAGGHWGAFITTVVSFFLAEMGDKTQLATIALGARFHRTSLVVCGSTLGILAADGLAIAFGERLTRRIPMAWMRRMASLLFALFGLLILFSFG